MKKRLNEVDDGQDFEIKFNGPKPFAKQNVIKKDEEKQEVTQESDELEFSSDEETDEVKKESVNLFSIIERFNFNEALDPNKYAHISDDKPDYRSPRYIKKPVERDEYDDRYEYPLTDEEKAEIEAADNDPHNEDNYEKHEQTPGDYISFTTMSMAFGSPDDPNGYIQNIRELATEINKQWHIEDAQTEEEYEEIALKVTKDYFKKHGKNFDQFDESKKYSKNNLNEINIMKLNKMAGLISEWNPFSSKKKVNNQQDISKFVGTKISVYVNLLDHFSNDELKKTLVPGSILNKNVWLTGTVKDVNKNNLVLKLLLKNKVIEVEYDENTVSGKSSKQLNSSLSKQELNWLNNVENQSSLTEPKSKFKEQESENDERNRHWKDVTHKANIENLKSQKQEPGRNYQKPIGPIGKDYK